MRYVLPLVLLLGCAKTSGPPPVTGTSDPLVQRPTPAPPVSDPMAHAKKLFRQKCAGCHGGSRRVGPRLGPGYNARVWIKGVLLNPSGDEYFGRTKIRGMKPVSQRGDDLDALVELVYSQTGAADVRTDVARRGRAVFDSAGCKDCHALDGTTAGKGPNLGGRGSLDGLTAYLAEPGHARWFGAANQMPRFGDKLSQADRRALARYILSWQRGATTLPP